MRHFLPLLAAALFPATAQACRVSSAMTPLLHERLPRPFPADAIAADVVIVADDSTDEGGALEARIVRMLRGTYRGTRLRIDRTIRSSCDRAPRVGDRGIAVGRVLSTSGDWLVIAPIRAPSDRELGRELRLRR